MKNQFGGTQCQALAKSGRRCTRNALIDDPDLVCQAHRQYGFTLWTPDKPDPGPKRLPTGTPRRITPEVKARMIDLVRSGSRKRSVAEAIGVSRVALNNHLQTDPDFARAWTDAESEAVERLEEKLYDLAAQGHFNALVTELRARKPEVYAQDKRGGDVNIAIGSGSQVAVLTEGERLERIRELAKHLGPDVQAELGMEVIDVE